MSDRPRESWAVAADRLDLQNRDESARRNGCTERSTVETPTGVKDPPDMHARRSDHHASSR